MATFFNIFILFYDILFLNVIVHLKGICIAAIDVAYVWHYYAKKIYICKNLFVWWMDG